jgi:hypothetical protein
MIYVLLGSWHDIRADWVSLSFSRCLVLITVFSYAPRAATARLSLAVARPPAVVANRPFGASKEACDF